MKFLLAFPLLTLFISTIAVAGEFKVLTYNIYRKPEPFGMGDTHAAKRVKHLCKVLRTTDYDVIMLQEVWLAKDRKNLAKCGYDFSVDIGVIDNDLPGRAAQVGREQNLETGLLLLSRYPIKKVIKKFYADRGNWRRIFIDGESIVSKAVYAAQIQISSLKNVWFVNTHLVANYCDTFPWIGCNSYEAIRAKQLKEVSQLVSKLDGPIVFGGDLNMGPKLSTRDRIWDKFDVYFPGFSQASHDETASSTSSSRNMFKVYDNGKIDHLFGSNDLTPLDGNVVFDQLMNIEGMSLHLSDHFGWETTFSF